MRERQKSRLGWDSVLLFVLCGRGPDATSAFRYLANELILSELVGSALGRYASPIASSPRRACGTHQASSSLAHSRSAGSGAAGMPCLPPGGKSPAGPPSGVGLGDY
jgi:hypothetical protein